VFGVIKQLDFASTSSKQNTNSQKIGLFEKNITTNKRKIKIELGEETNRCFLQEIPRNLGGDKKIIEKYVNFEKKNEGSEIKPKAISN